MNIKIIIFVLFVWVSFIPFAKATTSESSGFLSSLKFTDVGVVAFSISGDSLCQEITFAYDEDSKSQSALLVVAIASRATVRAGWSNTGMGCTLNWIDIVKS